MRITAANPRRFLSPWSLRVATLALGLAVLPATGECDTDPRCLKLCRTAGYRLGYCQRQCAVETEAPPDVSPPPAVRQPAPPQLMLPPARKLDPQCMSDCGARGFMPNYCKQ